MVPLDPLAQFSFSSPLLFYKWGEEIRIDESSLHMKKVEMPTDGMSLKKTLQVTN